MILRAGTSRIGTLRRLAACLALAGLLGTAVSCSRRQDAQQAGAGAGRAITKTAKNGPIEATVEVFPDAPVLGDPVRLTLTARAPAGVRLQMPAFGEALGRFTIADYAPRDRVLADGGTESSQIYTLQTPMSGVQTIPPLSIEYADNRPGQAGQQADPDSAGLQELLTEAISIEVKSASEEGVPLELKPARGRLEPRVFDSPRNRLLAGAGAIALLAGAAAFFWWWRQRRETVVRASPYETALKRLSRLEARGLPAADSADAWYVELSGIVRSYLEDRFALRAPELTTEEFIREAGRSPELQPEHRRLLASFLERCDQVKFAGYQPGHEESREAIVAARRFVNDSRPQTASAETVSGPGEAGHAAA